MESFSDMSPIWDLSQATTFSQLPDDDFLALLQKQFPTPQAQYHQMDFTLDGTGVNPQSISHYSLPSLSPPSADSSPSPPGEDHSLKRKASGDDDLEEGPSKAQHTLSNGKKGAASRRKSSGAGASTNTEDARLLKRKEQNRAAQRAFRERKEKHVKDASSENENLRDLLARLQNENVMLKQKQQQQAQQPPQQQQFTFSVPKTPAVPSGSPAVGRSPATVMPPNANPLDWSSLQSFDPTMLNLLDDTPQATATENAMQMNFGFAQPPVVQQQGSSTLSHALTTIASNPMFTSFASSFDLAPPHFSLASAASKPSPVASTSSSSTAVKLPTTAAVASPFGFDLPSSLAAWSTPNPDNTFDDLFGGIMGSNAIDFNEFNVLMQSPGSSAISPVAHHATLGTQAGGHSPANSTTSSSSRSSDPLFNTPRETSSDSDFDSGYEATECPKSREELQERVHLDGQSVFTTEPTPLTLHKGESSVMCEGSTFPSTEVNENNLEILDAWRTVTSNPEFRDSDIAELCTEFSAKARCDGTKVVLEPQGVRTIIESLTEKHNRSSQ
uniref:BZIP family transcriptional factor n=1 Tax=Mycena chlorophos TaxID=658473 RepID=A0ABQ0LGW8_MYCCL|nr:BZIP family transcriptional factor [Mycena chlorophos]